MTENKKLLLLLADDSPDDRDLFKLALAKAGSPFSVVHEASNGVEVIQYLSGEESFADRRKYPFPDILLLDLKMPLQSGFEVLEWLQGKVFARRLQVAVLTGSVSAADRSHALELGVIHYYLKPYEGKGWAYIIQDMEREFASE